MYMQANSCMVRRQVCSAMASRMMATCIDVDCGDLVTLKGVNVKNNYYGKDCMTAVSTDMGVQAVCICSPQGIDYIRSLFYSNGFAHSSSHYLPLQ